MRQAVDEMSLALSRLTPRCNRRTVTSWRVRRHWRCMEQRASRPFVLTFSRFRKRRWGVHQNRCTPSM